MMRAGILSAGLALLSACAAGVAAPEAPVERQVERFLAEYFEAVGRANPVEVGRFLAPEFQIQRESGGYTRAQFLSASIPRLQSKARFSDIVATRGEGVIVARFVMDVEEIIDGRRVERRAPQIAVIRTAPGGWQFVAAANLADPLR